jgi:archaellum component FlaF (FlaF/FlaG flagellin family)
MALADGDTNEIVIGASAVGAGSNSVVLGNDSITKTVLKGNVGIGTTTPGGTLDVAGDASGYTTGILVTDTRAATLDAGGKIIFRAYGSGVSGNVYNAAMIKSGREIAANNNLKSNLQFFTNNDFNGEGYAPAERMRITANGNVGIGTTNPGAKLDVNGDANFGTNSWLKLIDTGAGNGRLTVTAIGSLDFGGALLFRNNAGTVEYARITSAGNIGIGTTSPDGKLEVSANTTGSGYGTFLRITNTNTDANQYVNHRVSLILTGYDYPGTTKTDITLQKENNNLSINTPSGGWIGLQNSQQGNIGLRKGYPSYPIDIVGTTNISSGNLYVDGNVGIGTTNPGNKLSVKDGAVSFQSSVQASWGEIVGMDYDSSSDTLRLRSNNGSTNLNQTNLSIQRTTGNVGIGTTNPGSYKLNVVGDVLVTGSFYATVKHFRIPDKDNPEKTITYTSVEANENLVLLKGKLNSKNNKVDIELPKEWKWLVDNDSITIFFSSEEYDQKLNYIIKDGYVQIRNRAIFNSGIKCSYLIMATRKDIKKLEVYS